MPTLELDFEAYCAKCGAGICNNCTDGKTRGRGQSYIDIEPCEYCLEKALEEGKDEGYKEYEKELEKNN